jgi:hypothetical protein
VKNRGKMYILDKHGIYMTNNSSGLAELS